MTLAEAREIFDGWPDYPPVFLMLKGLVEGLAGRPNDRPALPSESVRSISPPPNDDATLERIATDSLGQIPLMRRPDPQLAAMKLETDFDALRQRNLERRLEIAMRKAGVTPRV